MENREILLEKLAKEEFEARMLLEGMSTMNVYGLTYEERKKQAVEYARAKYRHAEAKRKLDSVIG